MHNDIYDIEGQLGIKKPRARNPEAQPARQQTGTVPNSSESPYANIPPQILNNQATANVNGTQPRTESPYANIPEGLAQQPNLQQGNRAPQSAPPPRPPRLDLQGNAAPRRDTVVIPRDEQKPVSVQMTGTFVSHFGRGYDTEQQGLIFKPSGNSDLLYHFSPAQAKQLKASNEDLIKQSMQNGDKTKVSLTKDDRDRTMWKVEPADQQQQQGLKKAR